MLKNIKVLLSIMIVAMLALGFITGCGSSSDDGGGGTSGGTVTGTVTDTNNNPLSGVGCTVITTDTTGKGTFTDTTDTDGVFLILGITPDGTWPLTLEKTGYITITTNVTTADGQTTEVPANETQMPVATTGNLTGTVTDATSGAALSDVSVALGTTTPVTTGTDGVYTFSSVTAGTYTLAASKTGYDDYSASVTVIADQTTTHNFTMEQSGPEPGKGKVVGLVTDSTGAGLSGVTCTTGSTSATTDSSGNYSLNNLTPGSATITFTKTGYNNGTVTVTVVADTTVTATTVVLVAGGTEKTNELCSLPRTTETTSTTAAGKYSGNPTVDSAGSYVVFQANQPLLATHITTNTHIYIYSKSAKTVAMVDKDPTGLEGDYAGRAAGTYVTSLNPFISDDGTMVAFDSTANNLLGQGNDANGVAAGVTGTLAAINNGRDVFGYVVSTGSVFMISVDYSNPVLGGYANTAKSTGGPSQKPTLSQDGTYCAFHSIAKNIVAPGFYENIDPMTTTNVYRTKITKASVTSNSSLMISQKMAGGSCLTAGADGYGRVNLDSINAYISRDGRFVVYQSDCGRNTAAAPTANNGLTSFVNGRWADGDYDIYLCDTNKTVNTWTSFVSMNKQNYSNITAQNFCVNPTVNDDGTKVTFFVTGMVADANWMTGWTADVTDIWLKDLSTGDLKIVSNANSGTRGATTSGMISRDGTLVVFSSLGNGFVQNDTNLTTDVFVCTLASNTFTRVNLSSSGEQTDNTVGNAYIVGVAPVRTVTDDCNPGGVAPIATGGSYMPFIGGSNDYIVFMSDAKNIATNVYYTPATFDVYLKKWK